MNFLRVVSEYVVRAVAEAPRFFVAVLLLCCAPALTYSVVEGARIFHFLLSAVGESVVIAYLCCLIAMTIRRAVWRSVFMGLCVAAVGVLALLEVGCLAATGTLLTDDTLALMLETDGVEAGGFMMQYFGLRAVAILLVAVAVTVALIYGLGWCVSRMCSRCVGRMVVDVVIAVLCVPGVSGIFRILPGAFIGDYERYLVWAGSGSENPNMLRANEVRFAASVVKMPCVANAYRLINGNYDRWLELQQEAWRRPAEASDTARFDVVVVIGESFIRSHSQLYGYYLPTNPWLTAERDGGRLIVYDQAYATANFTTPSLRNMLNLNDHSEGEQWYDGVYFPLVMKRAGYEVYHYDNQTVALNADRGISRMFYTPLIRDSVYSAVSDSVYACDGPFIDYVHSRYAASESAGRKLVLYHLKGQHFPASERYEGAGHFTAKDITIDRPWLTDVRRAEVADYDNATHYNDSIVGAIAARFSDRPTLMLYFSDHGEDCWDLAPMEARNKQMPDDAAWIDRQYHIPFFVWMSPSFIEGYPAVADRLREGADSRISLGDLGQMILGLCGVETVYYDPSRDPLQKL